jgi:ferredoxin, 2Fe-2S
MVQVTFIEPSGREVALDAQPGWSMMQVATSKGVHGIEAECGGSCACATCHCYVEGDAAARIPAPAENELAMLENVVAERRPNSRLSCQIKAAPELDGLVLRVAEEQS